MTLKKENPGALGNATGADNKAGELSNDNSEKRLTRQQAWRKKHPKKYLCHLTVQNALRLGLLEKMPCVVCGDPKSEAHHDCYDRPLDVTWLCRDHHKAHHKAQGS